MVKEFIVKETKYGRDWKKIGEDIDFLDDNKKYRPGLFFSRIKHILLWEERSDPYDHQTKVLDVSRKIFVQDRLFTRLISIRVSPYNEGSFFFILQIFLMKGEISWEKII